MAKSVSWPSQSVACRVSPLLAESVSCWPKQSVVGRSSQLVQQGRELNCLFNLGIIFRRLTESAKWLERPNDSIDQAIVNRMPHRARKIRITFGHLRKSAWRLIRPYPSAIPVRKFLSPLLNSKKNIFVIRLPAIVAL